MLPIHNDLVNKYRYFLLSTLIALLAACAPTMPTATPTPSLTPPPTATPTPTPTPTPIPPITLEIHWPTQVSALVAPPVEVELLSPSGVAVTATVSAAVIDPEGARYWASELTPRSGQTIYTAAEPLQLPLEPMPGDWLLTLDVEASLDVIGERTKRFRPTRPPLHDLTESVPDVVKLDVPRAFAEVRHVGNRTAGGRVWQYGDGLVELWWAPGPDEPLLLNNAIVMLETTYDDLNRPEVPDVQEIQPGGQPGFLFQEVWPGGEGGPGKALVIQGPDAWLYLVRARALDGDKIPSLVNQVWSTFAFVEQDSSS
jgi:hypothetical protein